MNSLSCLEQSKTLNENLPAKTARFIFSLFHCQNYLCAHISVFMFSKHSKPKPELHFTSLNLQDLLARMRLGTDRTLARCTFDGTIFAPKVRLFKYYNVSYSFPQGAGE